MRLSCGERARGAMGRCKEARVCLEKSSYSKSKYRQLIAPAQHPKEENRRNGSKRLAEPSRAGL
jgi:hypothetical protein